MPITIYEPGTVVLVPFPFSDLSGSKKRPAVVISDPRLQQARHEIIVMMISSRPPADEIDLSLRYWEKAGLLRPSKVRVGRVFTVDEKAACRTLGRLHEEDWSDLKEKWLALQG